MNSQFEHIQFRYKYEESSGQMILDIDKKYSLDRKVCGLIMEQKSKFLFPARITEDSTNYHFYYNITEVTNLFAWSAELSEEEKTAQLCRFPEMVNELLNLGISPGQLLISDRYIFRNDNTGSLLFLCIPFGDWEIQREILQVSKAFIQSCAGYLWNAFPYSRLESMREAESGGENGAQNLRSAFLVRNSTGEKLKIISRRMIVGARDDASDLFITGNGSISRQHCIINQENGKFFLTDLDSKNSTFLNDNRLMPYVSVEIENASIIQLADEKFHFEIVEEEGIMSYEVSEMRHRSK